jgi:hypothetical protein
LGEGTLFKFVQLKGQVVFKGEIITKILKMEWGHLKIFFLRAMKPEELKFTQKLSDLE